MAYCSIIQWGMNLVFDCYLYRPNCSMMQIARGGWLWRDSGSVCICFASGYVVFKPLIWYFYPSIENIRDLFLFTMFLCTFFARVESLNRKCNFLLREEDGKFRKSLCCPRLLAGEKSNLWIRINRSKTNRKITRKRRLRIRACNAFYCCILLFLAGDIEVNPGPNMQTFSVIDCSRLEGAAGSLLVAMGYTHQGHAAWPYPPFQDNRGQSGSILLFEMLHFWR